MIPDVGSAILVNHGGSYSFRTLGLRWGADVQNCGKWVRFIILTVRFDLILSLPWRRVGKSPQGGRCRAIPVQSYVTHTGAVRWFLWPNYCGFKCFL